MTTNSQMRRKIVAELAPGGCEDTDVPIEGELWTEIQREFPVFALFRSDRQSSDQDAEAQQPIKAAVKEAISAVQPQLGADRSKHLNNCRKMIES